MLCYKATDADVGEKLLIIASTCTSWLVLAEFTMHRSRAVLVRHSSLFTSSFHSWGKSKASRVVFRRRQRRKRVEIVEIHYFILLWTAKEKIFINIRRVESSLPLAQTCRLVRTFSPVLFSAFSSRSASPVSPFLSHLIIFFRLSLRGIHYYYDVSATMKRLVKLKREKGAEDNTRHAAVTWKIRKSQPTISKSLWGKSEFFSADVGDGALSYETTRERELRNTKKT